MVRFASRATASCAIALALLFTASAAQAQSGLSAIWAVDDGEKIFRDDLSNPLKLAGESNSVWDGATVRLFAARNEIVAFQLILEAGPGGVLDVDVAVSSLSNGIDTIPGSHPLPQPNSYVGIGVELFTEHYLNVTQYSYNDPGWGGFYTTAAANPQITGWIPDALIPFSATQGKGGAPFDIGASLNQGVWVDIYVGKGMSPGVYTGTIQITVGESPAAEIPLELEVLDLTLPDKNHYRSMVFYSDYCIRPRHNLSWGSELWEMLLHYHRMAHRHRIELIGSGSWDELTYLGTTLTGEAFTPANGYEGPGEGMGNSLFSVHTYGWSFGDTEPEYRANSDAWVSWFDANAPYVEYFLYLTDEPGPAMYDWIIERAGWIHNNPGPGQRLPVLITRWPIAELIGAIDIWCMQSPSCDPSDIAAARARGERGWLYAGNRPQTPMDVIDEYGVALRLKPWIAYKDEISRWFTWESTHWYPNSNEVPNDQPKNVFVDPVTFYAGYDGSRGNGDGTMFYPGEDYVFPDQNRAHPGPMSSIRMKMYRRGVQDYEYMWLAEQAGHGQEVAALLDDLLPHVMWEALVVPDWSNSNAVYEDARGQLATMAMQPVVPRVLLEVHPNERAPGLHDPQFLGGDPWTQPTSSAAGSYWWKHYVFSGSDVLWIQLCAQCWDDNQHGYGDDDNLLLEIDGARPPDYDGIQTGTSSWQWRGDRIFGKRHTYRFLYLAGVPGIQKHQLSIGADESPVLWWLKVTDLEPGVIQAIE